MNPLNRPQATAAPSESLIESASSGSHFGQASLIIGAFWLLLFFGGFPIAFIDDLFFTGAAVNMANGGSFVNPFSPGTQFTGDGGHFFAYMPLHSYVLAAWLKVFGVSTSSLTFFQCLMGGLGSAGFYWTLRHRYQGFFLPLGISLSLAILLSALGLRPDALGWALFAWGTTLIVSRSYGSWTLASVSLFLGLIVNPSLAVLIPVVVTAAFVRLYRSRAIPAREWLLRLGILLAALLFTVALFLRLIDFDLGPFLSAFDRARAIAEGRNEILVAVHQMLTQHRLDRNILSQLLLPPLVTGILVSVIWFNRPQFDIPITNWLLGALALTQLILFLPAMTSNGSVRVPMFFDAMIALYFAAHARRGFRLYGRLGWAIVCAGFLFGSGHFPTQWMALAVNPLKLSPIPLRKQLAQAHPTFVYVDEFALRQVLKYQLAPNCRDFHFNEQTKYPNPLRFPKGGVLLVSRETAFNMRFPGYPKTKRPPALPVFGAVFPGLTDNPYDCVLIPTTGPAVATLQASNGGWKKY